MAQMGMDVDAVERVGHQLTQSASAVERIVSTLDKTVSGLQQRWDGPDVERFIRSWPTFRRSLLAAQAGIAGLGQSAYNNAAEQRTASGVTRGGRVSPAAAESAPATAGDRWAMIHSVGQDGVRIQGVRGEDGVTRYVVYLQGTDPSSRALWRTEDNISEVGGTPTATGAYILKLMHENIPEGADVMLVGYSQGGIYAQQLASDTAFHVTDVMTFGSPFLSDDNVSGGANVVRIHDEFDLVPHLDIGQQATHDAGSVVDAIGTAWRSIFGDDKGAVAHRVDQLNEGQHLDYQTHSDVVPTPAGLGTHTDIRTYAEGANEFEREAAQTTEGRAVLASQARYTGQIVSDTDGNT